MKRFTNILVLCDKELTHTQALESALQIAEENNASITLLLVLPPLTALQTFAKTQTPEQIQQSYQQHYLHKLQQLTAHYADQALIRCKVVVGTNFIETIRAVLRNHHDLVVKVAEPTSWVQRLLGSNDMHLLRKCPCPLWILKPGTTSHGGKVVATVDIEPQGLLFTQNERHEDQLNQQIVELAAATATMHQASLDFLHAWQPQDAGLVLMWCDHPEQAQLEMEQSLFQSQQAGLERFKQQVHERHI
jgi:nucleotide-binding universal stress UspA family protein